MQGIEDRAKKKWFLDTDPLKLFFQRVESASESRIDNGIDCYFLEEAVKGKKIIKFENAGLQIGKARNSLGTIFKVWFSFIFLLNENVSGLQEQGRISLYIRHNEAPRQAQVYGSRCPKGMDPSNTEEQCLFWMVYTTSQAEGFSI